MYSSLEIILLESSKSTTSSKNLSFYDIIHFFVLTELLGDQESFSAIESNVTKWDGYSVLVKQLGSLVLVKLKTSHGQVLIHDESSVHHSAGLEPTHTRHLHAKQVKHLFYLIIKESNKKIIHYSLN
jgi:hypothetical protein